jgi:hypothetical protein
MGGGRSRRRGSLDDRRPDRERGRHSDDPKLTVALADYSYQDLDKVAAKYLEKTSSSFNSQLASSNALTKDAEGKITGFASNFNIVNGGGELNFGNVLGYSTGLFGEVAYNTQADSDGSGFAVGAGFGNSGRDCITTASRSRHGPLPHVPTSRQGCPRDIQLQRHRLRDVVGNAEGSTNVQRASCGSTTCCSPTSN